MSRKKRKNKQKATPKVAKAKKMLTLKQARFAAALMKALKTNSKGGVAEFNSQSVTG
jgi:hypothetical protein